MKTKRILRKTLKADLDKTNSELSRLKEVIEKLENELKAVDCDSKKTVKVLKLKEKELYYRI